MKASYMWMHGCVGPGKNLGFYSVATGNMNIQ